MTDEGFSAVPINVRMAIHLVNKRHGVWARREWSPMREDYVFVISDGRLAKSFVSTNWNKVLDRAAQAWRN